MKFQTQADLKKQVCFIRVPRSADCARMADLAAQLGYRSSAEDIRKRLSEMKNGAEYAVFVAELPSGRVAGWVGVYMFRSVETPNCVEISGLVVDCNLRSRGIGKQLLQAAEDWARHVGCYVISVKSNIIRDRAHLFYTRNGYVHSKTQKEFRKELLPVQGPRRNGYADARK